MVQPAGCLARFLKHERLYSGSNPRWAICDPACGAGHSGHFYGGLVHALSSNVRMGSYHDIGGVDNDALPRARYLRTTLRLYAGQSLATGKPPGARFPLDLTSYAAIGSIDVGSSSGGRELLTRFDTGQRWRIVSRRLESAVAPSRQRRIAAAMVASHQKQCPGEGIG